MKRQASDTVRETSERALGCGAVGRLYLVLIALLSACAFQPAPADCTAMAPDAHRLAASAQTDVFGNVVLIGTVTSSEVRPRADPPIVTFDLAVEFILRGDAAPFESVYSNLEDGLSMTVEDDQQVVVAGNREIDGRIRIVGCEGFTATRQIDNATEAELKQLADDVREP